MYRNFIIGITALIVLLLGATAVNAASRQALPGDSLYGLKLSIENAQLSAAGENSAKAKLNIAFGENRLAEIEKLAEQDRYENITTAVNGLEEQLAQASMHVEKVSEIDPASAAALNQELTNLYAKQAKIYGALMSTIPETVLPTLQSSLNGNANDDNGNDNDDDNGNANDDNGNDNDDDNANDDNGNDNDDDNGNGNANDDDNGNGNDDNGNDNDDDNGNANDDNGNDNDDDNGNANDDNGNDNDDDNGNANDDNGNDNDNANANDDNDNDDDDDDNDNDNNGNDNDDNDN